MRVALEKNRCAAVAALVGVALGGLAMVGCDRPDWENPEYIAQVLEEGDQRTRHQAVSLLREIDEEDRAAVAPALATAYLEEERLRSDIMHHLLEWRDEGAMDAYLAELEEDHTGRSARVAEMLGRIELRDAIPQMIEIFEGTSNNDRRVGILNGLAAMPDVQALDAAVEVLDLDVDNYPIDLHRAACTLVGEVALEDPEAITDEAREKIIYARFLGDERGRHTSEQCGLAIQQIGPSMVPQLIELFNGDNDDVQGLLMTYDSPADGEHFPQNQSRQRAVEHLSSLRAPEAVELFSEYIQTTVEVPQNLDSNEQKSAWGGTERRVLNEMIRGLGNIGEHEARPVIEGVLSRETLGEHWGAIVGVPEAFQYQQNSARALADLGDREARSALLEVEVQSEWVNHLQGQEVAATEIFRPAWLGAQSFTYLGLAEDRGRFDEFAGQIGDDDLKEMVEGFASAFDVMDECEEVEDDGEKASCFAGFIDSDDTHQAIKAAFEVARLPAEVAGPVIAEAIKTDDLNARQKITVVAYRVPTAELLANVEELIDAGEGSSDDAVRADRRRLQMLHAWLHHHVE